MCQIIEPSIIFDIRLISVFSLLNQGAILALLRSSISLTRSCITGGSSEFVMFVDSTSTATTDMNYIADYKSEKCPSGPRLFKEAAGSGCFVGSGQCTGACVPVADQTECRANGVPTSAPSTLPTTAPTLPPKITSISPSDSPIGAPKNASDFPSDSPVLTSTAPSDFPSDFPSESPTPPALPQTTSPAPTFPPTTQAPTDVPSMTPAPTISSGPTMEPTASAAPTISMVPTTTLSSGPSSVPTYIRAPPPTEIVQQPSPSPIRPNGSHQGPSKKSKGSKKGKKGSKSKKKLGKKTKNKTKRHNSKGKGKGKGGAYDDALRSLSSERSAALSGATSHLLGGGFRQPWQQQNSLRASPATPERINKNEP
jgi:hypothetical protein